MVIAKIRKMSIKGVKLKSESFFSISPGVLELWRKNLRGGGRIPPPPGPDRVKKLILVGGRFGEGVGCQEKRPKDALCEKIDL